MRKLLRIFLLFVLAAAIFGAPAPQPAQASAEAVNETPYSMVPSGVYSYALAAPKVFWNNLVPGCGPALPNPIDSPTAAYTETVSRKAVTGSTVRNLFAAGHNCAEGQILSPLAADASFVYWLEAGGLKKLSTDANPGDAPALMNALVKGPGEIADGGDRIYVLDSTANQLSYVLKSNNQRVVLFSVAAGAKSLQTDTKYVYYLNGATLVRVDPSAVTTKNLTTSVTSYFPEKHVILCTILQGCTYSYKVYVGKSRNIYIYDNSNDTLSAAIYTASDTTASVEAMVTDLNNLYFFQSITGVVCDLLCSYTYALYRIPRAGGAPSGSLTSYAPIIGTNDFNLKTDGTFLFWQWGDALARLPNNAGVAVSANLSITGMEVTQGIQSLSNSVLLVMDKRTFVRVYVKSSSGSVPGVTGLLSANGLPDDPLVPINASGTSITVRANPNRNDLEQSFLFEIPRKWTEMGFLTLHFELNPYKYPLETNYADNSKNTTVSFLLSPTLSLELFRLDYKIGGKTYSPRLTKDMLQAFSWIMRAYPIGGPLGQYFKPRIWTVDGGTYLGSLVDRSNPDCLDVYDDPKDDVSLCASYFMNGWLDYYREATSDGDLNVGLKTGAFYYGMITDASGNFPRGQAIYDLTSVGPAGIPGQYALGSSASWDFDNSYADWYAAHEVGHSLGRAHPDSGSDDPSTNARENCGHSRSDSSYPYGSIYAATAPIGPSNGSIEGFDPGSTTYGVARAIYPSSIWNDVMSYCQSQWISDYTYLAMWSYMIVHPSAPLPADRIQQSPSVVGDFLITSGEVVSTTAKANFSLLRRVTSVTSKSVDNPAGGYALRLLNASDQVLATHKFVGSATHDPTRLSFNLVVDYLAGTQKIQVIRVSDSHVLKTVLVSAHAPLVSNVALQGAPNPVTGVVTLNWNASDQDNDLLSYDVGFSLNGGATFTPLANNISAKTTQIDTSMLAGSNNAVFRVTASDGINSGYANSPAYVMADKPPQPMILNPANNTQVHYGQLVDFEAVALDAKDNLVDSSGFTWKDSDGKVLGTGAQMSLANLPVGTNVITLEVANSANLKASTQVTVIVDDNLALPGANLSVSPQQVGWQIDAGVTALQTYDIQINNSGGSSSMAWTASSDQPWLQLSAAGGTVDDVNGQSVVTLTADPAGMLPGQSRLAHVTVTKPAGGGTPQQVLVIPVSLVMGDVMDSAPQAFTGFKIYMPVVKK